VGPTRMFWQRLLGYCKRELRRGAATLSVKLKSYRGDPGHDEIDILANNAISDLKVDREWCQRRNQAVFTLKIPCCWAGLVNYQDPPLTFKNSVTDVI